MTWPRGGQSAGRIDLPRMPLPPEPPAEDDFPCCSHVAPTCSRSGSSEEPKYTESDMRVLTEAALRLGRKEAGEEIAAAIEHRRANTAHRIPWEAFTDAAKVAREMFADPKVKRERREPCDSDCPCICHDGWGGAHPNQDCRDAITDPEEPK